MIFQDGKVRWMLRVIAEKPDYEFQTRRVGGDHDALVRVCKKCRFTLGPNGDDTRGFCAIDGPSVCGRNEKSMLSVIRLWYGASWRVKHQVGRDYSVRPGRTAKSLPSIRQLITDIREQRLQDITDEDCWAEGIIAYPTVGMPREDGDFCRYGWGLHGGAWPTPQMAYEGMWEALDYPKGKRWEDNPVVFAYTYRLVMR